MDKKIYWPPKTEVDGEKIEPGRAIAALALIFLGSWALFLGAVASLIYAVRWAWEGGGS